MENQEQPPPPPVTSAPPYPHASFKNLLQQQQQQQLQMFWSYQRQEIELANDFKNHQLPLARIKKIMKADEDVRMISAEAPILFAKACELFILELTIRSWLHAEENKRRTLQKNDIAAAIARTDIFDFLVDIVPRDEIKEEGLGLVGGPNTVAGTSGDGGPTAAGLPYYYPSMMMGQPAMDPAVYVDQQHQQQWQPMWHGQQQQQQGIVDDGMAGAFGAGGDADEQGYAVGHQHHHPSTTAGS